MGLQIVLVRHGETAWSRTGQHTGHTDIPLTEAGEVQARRLAALLGRLPFTQVITSPLQRARRTCELAGLGAAAHVDPDVIEWHYGDYEGRTLADIRAERPGWTVFDDGCPGGESAAQVSARADRVVQRLGTLDGLVAVFSHGHFLRALAVRWIGLPLRTGRHLGLDTGSLTVLGYDHRDMEVPMISTWNAVSNDLFDLAPHAS
jgi:broad specificity phosphatase PhoE